MTVRAKLQLSSITDHGDPVARTVKFTAIYDQSIPEDQRFCDATPWGTFEMHVNNPQALEQFKVGESYYVDLTPVPK